MGATVTAADGRRAAAAAAYARDRYLGGFVDDAAADAYAASVGANMAPGTRYFNTTTNSDRV